MIQKLYIRNYALIDELEIDFRPGFTVLTGETGAGKSIIMGALSLILGQRADSKAVKDVAQKTVIEGTFDISSYAMTAFFEENDLDYDPSGHCLLRRELSPQGKSRAFINDTPVSLSLLKELGEQLIDIHSQHQNLLLGDNRFQLRMIDIWADDEASLSQYRDEYRRYRALNEKLVSLRRENEEKRREEDYLRFQYDQLCEAHLQVGEQSALEEEQEMLTHAGEIKNGLYAISRCLDGEEGGVLPSLKETRSLLRSLQRVYPAVEPLDQRIESAYIEIKDILSEIDDRQESVAVDPARLQQVYTYIYFDLLYGPATETSPLFSRRADGIAGRLAKAPRRDRTCRRRGGRIAGGADGTGAGAAVAGRTAVGRAARCRRALYRETGRAGASVGHAPSAL